MFARPPSEAVGKCGWPSKLGVEHTIANLPWRRVAGLMGNQP
jgi:hypothetical protein